jgi:D-alanyl-D-alanine carboxypeptidase
MDGRTGKLIQGYNENVPREVASITKIMTCYVALQLCKYWGIALEETYFEVSMFAATVGGTTASLCAGD